MTTDPSAGTVVRFSRWAIFQHAAMIVLFVLLLLTGLPQKWPYFEISRWLIEHLGGIFAVRWVHRLAGLVMTVLTIVHVGVAVGGLLLRRFQPTMLLTRRDFADAVQNLRFYLGRAEAPPRFGRYDYRQKFEYWGLIFGGAVMVVSGLVLYFPIAVSRWLPAELIPAAKVLHSNEALLAFLIVLIWHMYGAHLNPEVFPIDSSIFTGRISVERLRHEHPLEWEEMQARLEAKAAPPPEPPRRPAG
jgi:formate dehydrogenase gamma subunit